MGEGLQLLDQKGTPAAAAQPLERVRVWRTAEDLLAAREQWSAVPWRTFEADLDVFLAVVDARRETIRPHVIAVERDGRVSGALMLRLERVPLSTSLGYATRSAADGATAVRSVLTEAPDIVLLDVYMPGLSGVGALPTIVALAPNAKVIMISGAANEDVLKRSLAFGAHDYVTKPFEISSLSRALETALAMRRLETGPETTSGG